jgi:hypothetical protein
MTASPGLIRRVAQKPTILACLAHQLNDLLIWVLLGAHLGRARRAARRWC